MPVDRHHPTSISVDLPPHNLTSSTIPESSRTHHDTLINASYSLGSERYVFNSQRFPHRHAFLIFNQLTSEAKPTTALIPSRAGPSAFISSTSSKSATTEVTPAQNAQGPPLSVTGKPRREVPLPSQEKKEGAMQYALYVPPHRSAMSFHPRRKHMRLRYATTGPHSTRSPIGPVNPHCGP